MNRTNVAKATMTKTPRKVAQVEWTSLTRLRPGWIVGASLGHCSATSPTMRHWRLLYLRGTWHRRCPEGARELGCPLLQ